MLKIMYYNFSKMGRLNENYLFSLYRDYHCCCKETEKALERNLTWLPSRANVRLDGMKNCDTE